MQHSTRSSDMRIGAVLILCRSAMFAALDARAGACRHASGTAKGEADEPLTLA